MARKMKTMDGNTATTHIAYGFSEVAGIYPITPSSTMAEHADEWSAQGKKNMFGQVVKVVELQSEAGAAGTVHGSLQAGALTTTFTASQGLLLMIPNMYKMAGELLPAVLHVSARAIAAHALSIFGDHSDVMACRQTGFAMLASTNVQECMHLAAVAHLSAIKGRVPFVHFFDGFRTSHEIQKIEVLEYEELLPLIDMEALNKFRNSSLNPERPVSRGSAQNPDIFFQAKESSNPFYNAVPSIVENYMKEINKLTGRDYQLFNYYGAKDADRIIIAMGSVCDCIEETIDNLNANGEKVGLLKIRLFRPFSVDHFLKTVPNSVKKIAVLDRTKEPGAIGEPLYQDVVTSYFEKNEHPIIVGGRYGLGSKDVTPSQIKAVFDNLKNNTPKNHFTIGINDDVTKLSLPDDPNFNIVDNNTFAAKFWGLGSDGTVGANKNTIKIIGDNTEMYAQAYFSYDSKKSGGVTQSHLRFGKNPIRSTYLVNSADFVACHNFSYMDKYEIVNDLRDGGTFLLNSQFSESETLEIIPANVKRYIAEHNIKFYLINATKIANDLGLGGRINTILQSAFFKLANIIPIDEAIEYMKKAIASTYGKKGEAVVNMNNAAVDAGANQIIEIKVSDDWKNAKDKDLPENHITKDTPNFVKDILIPVNNLKGDYIPVSKFVGIEDGTFPQGTAAYEKRGIAVNVPTWIKENCIQCNQCSYVCPHATIRPFVSTDEELKNAPSGYKSVPIKNADGMNFTIQIDTLDCTGCGNCAEVCPSKEKSLVMTPLETQTNEMENWYFATKLEPKQNMLSPNTVKGSQFEKPLLEFSGACAGCGETPYAKLVTQLFGDRMYIANATGCSSIWGNSAPATPYTTNHKGQGPAWGNSLFEDAAEYGYGMKLGFTQIRDGLKQRVEKAILETDKADVKEALQQWVASYNNASESKTASQNLADVLSNYPKCDTCKSILLQKDHFVKKSQWIFGGDGWAYDIGFGGLDHVIASGEDINILIFDTEVYSNTGGQASKATPAAAVAKFASNGKNVRKKDLGLIAMSYGYIYVAQVAMGANQNQLIKALVEAEAYNGPSIIIAYAPCIEHGMKGGLYNAQNQTKKAVESGYWHLYRYNPNLENEGKNPFVLDSKAPVGDFQAFINSESRYTSLRTMYPDIADKLFALTEENAKKKKVPTATLR